MFLWLVKYNNNTDLNIRCAIVMAHTFESSFALSDEYRLSTTLNSCELHDLGFETATSNNGIYCYYSSQKLVLILPSHKQRLEG